MITIKIKLKMASNKVQTIFQPINAGSTMKKIIVYKKWKYLTQMLIFIIVDVIKILAGIYCVIILVDDVQIGVFVNYCLFACLFLESSLGLIMYVSILILTLIRHNFYLEWLRWMAAWYLKDSVDVLVTCDNPRVILEFKDISEV